MRRFILLALGLVLAAPAFTAERSPAPPGARVYFVGVNDGDRLVSPFRIGFGIANMQVAPAGQATPHSGHHHLLIDLEQMPSFDQPLPATNRIRHFGGGQTEIELDLAPGRHTLQLLLGDHNHVPHDPPVMSQRITVHVE